MKPVTKFEWIAIALVIVLVITGKLVHAKLVYDDWTCAIARCLKAKP